MDFLVLQLPLTCEHKMNLLVKYYLRLVVFIITYDKEQTLLLNKSYISV